MNAHSFSIILLLFSILLSLRKQDLTHLSMEPFSYRTMPFSPGPSLARGTIPWLVQTLIVDGLTRR